MEKRKTLKLFKDTNQAEPNFKIHTCNDRTKIKTTDKVVICDNNDTKLLEVSTTEGITIF